MSRERICSKCYQQEMTRYNFGEDIEAEKAFHAKDWCKCGYTSAEEMMVDQDMPFSDPKWIPLAKHFLNEYHIRLDEEQIRNSEQLVRFFLRLLKSSANNIGLSVTLINQKADEVYKFVSDGKTDRKPKTNIFSDRSMHYAAVALLANNFKNKVPEQKESYSEALEKTKTSWKWPFLYLICGMVLGSLLSYLFLMN
jgi:hypothetical protein